MLSADQHTTGSPLSGFGWFPAGGDFTGAGGDFTGRGESTSPILPLLSGGWRHVHEHVWDTVGLSDTELRVGQGLEMALWESLFQWQL